MSTPISGLASSIAANLVQYVDAYYFPSGEASIAQFIQGEIDDYYKRAPNSAPQELQRQIDILKEALGNVRFTANEALTQVSVLRRPVDELELTVRINNVLVREGIRTIGDLANTPLARLRNTPGMGRKALVEIQEALARYNITLDF